MSALIVWLSIAINVASLAVICYAGYMLLAAQTPDRFSEDAERVALRGLADAAHDLSGYMLLDPMPDGTWERLQQLDRAADFAERVLAR